MTHSFSSPSRTLHDMVEKYSCSSDDKDCMFDNCTECSSGNYANYLTSTLMHSLIRILILILIQAAWYLSTVGKHLISMLPRNASVSHLRKLPRGSKNPLCLSRGIFIQKDPKTIIITT